MSRRCAGSHESILNLIGRSESLFEVDLEDCSASLAAAIEGCRFLVVGGGGSIGQSVTKEIFRRKPAALHIVDLSENNLVELVRDLRSSLGYITGDFQALPLDSDSVEFRSFIKSQQAYDYILNLSALKHVRNEKDPYSLMRMVQVNIFNAEKLANLASKQHSKKFFCVSTDKAANPVNMMGASKRIMEMFVMRASRKVPVCSARFANVAFSDGSLLHGFNQRLSKLQPIAAPKDVRRYFITPQEAGELCLLSCILAKNGELFFPISGDRLRAISFAQIAKKYLDSLGYIPVLCDSEQEARERMKELAPNGKWPCFFFNSDTTGEKDLEEFYIEGEDIDLERYQSIGVIHHSNRCSDKSLTEFRTAVESLLVREKWTKEDLLSIFRRMLPEFIHIEKHKNLDQRM